MAPVDAEGCWKASGLFPAGKDTKKEAMMGAHNERRRELQVAITVVQAHPQATGAELDALIKEALQLKTTLVARVWRTQAQLIQSQPPAHQK